MAPKKLNGALAAFVSRFPTTFADLKRLYKGTTTLKDWQRVLPLCEELLYDPKLGAQFRAVMESVNQDTSVHGAVPEDKTIASQMIQARALAKGDIYVGETMNLHRIGIVLEQCAKKYGLSRRQRLAEAKHQLKLHQSSGGNPQ
jgi:hypothetical protein